MKNNPNSDSSSSVEELKQVVQSFVSERQWEVFHSPKNLATSILIEAAELAEHFQWLSVEQSREQASGLPADHPIAQELADVLSYVLAFANVSGIDLSQALRSKMLANASKYPPPNLAEVRLDTQSDSVDTSQFPTMDGG